MIKESKLIPWPDLILNAKSGNIEALDEIFQRMNGYLLAVANAKMDRSLEAKFGGSDVVQKSCMDAHSQIQRFRGTSEAQLRVWLKQILLSNLKDFSKAFTGTESRNLFRERLVETSRIPTRNCDTPSQIFARDESCDALWTAIEALSDRHRLVVEARHRWGWSYQEIANELNVTEVAARKIWTRAIQKLKLMLANEQAGA